MTYKIVDRIPDDEIVQRLLYRDGLILVVNKPSGLAVHKAGEGKHNLEQYFHLLQFGLKNPPLLAHRLDRGTSGCLVLARQKAGAQKMHELFSNGRIRKTYLALVHGVVKDDEGRIDLPLAKLSDERSCWRMKVDKTSSLEAISDFRVVERYENQTLLSLSPLTGRTHQLRVHCQALGHAIVGDDVYGDPEERDMPLHLHAAKIEIPLYEKKPPIVVTAEPPLHMKCSVN